MLIKQQKESTRNSSLAIWLLDGWWWISRISSASSDWEPDGVSLTHMEAPIYSHRISHYVPLKDFGKSQWVESNVWKNESNHSGHCALLALSFSWTLQLFPRVQQFLRATMHGNVCHQKSLGTSSFPWALLPWCQYTKIS